jgi:cell division protein ZapA (FtsZ GTPase activity inhibitor)
LENIITIELLDEQFKFKADTNSAVDPNEIARCLTEEVRRVEAGFPSYARKTNKLAIVMIAALNIAKNNIELQMRHQSLLATVASRAEKLDRLINSAG